MVVIQRWTLGEKFHSQGTRWYVSPVTFASVYATLGDKDQALAYLTLAADTKALGLVYVGHRRHGSCCASSAQRWGRSSHFLRSDPRFIQVQRRVKVG